jgi:hypothetical protein
MNKSDSSVMVVWTDGGTVDSLFMSGMLSTVMRSQEIGLPLAGFHVVSGNQIARQRQDVAELFLRTEIEWLLFVDSDIVLTPEAVRLIWESADKDSKPVVSGVYFISMNPNEPLMTPVPCVFRGDGYKNLPVHPLPVNELIKIDFAGLGICLIHRSVFEKLQENYPNCYFDITIGKQHISEDVSFFMKLQKLSIPVHAHTGASVNHVKRFAFDLNYYLLWWNTLGKELQEKHSKE